MCFLFSFERIVRLIRFNFHEVFIRFHGSPDFRNIPPTLRTGMMGCGGMCLKSGNSRVAVWRNPNFLAAMQNSSIERTPLRSASMHMKASFIDPNVFFAQCLKSATSDSEKALRYH